MRHQTRCVSVPKRTPSGNAMGAPGLAFETWDPPRKGQSRILPIFKAHLFNRSVGWAFGPPLEFLHFQSGEFAGGRHVAVFGLTNSLSCASPGLLVRGSGFSNPRERSRISIQGFSPGGGASNSIPRDAEDQANSSGLSLKPALTGFSQMYEWWCL